MRQIKSVVSLCVLLLTGVTSTTFSQGQLPAEIKPGGPAPELGLTKLLQAPEGAKADLNGLKGNVVVLEFWATWCAPCIAAMPHLNALSDDFKDKPIRFIAITDENESIVAPFLRRRALKTWVGLDANRSTMKSYSVRVFPTTVVIDRDGNVAAVTQPKKLTAELLGDLLDGKPIAKAQEKSDATKTTARKPAAQDDVKPVLAITIKPWNSVDYN